MQMPTLPLILVTPGLSLVPRLPELSVVVRLGPRRWFISHTRAHTSGLARSLTGGKVQIGPIPSPQSLACLERAVVSDLDDWSLG